MADKSIYGQESLTTECMNSGTSVVDLFTGRHLYSYPLYSKEGVLGLNLSLVYNSDYYNEQDNAVPCGKGWRLSLVDKYEPNSLVHVDGTGREHPMTLRQKATPYGTDEFDGDATRKYLKLTYGTGNYYYTDQNYELSTQTKLVLNQNTSYTFSNGKLYQIVYRNSAILTLAYDTSGRLVTITDNIDGKVVTLSYNTSGYLDKIAYPDGKSHSFGYEGQYLDYIRTAVGDTDFWYAAYLNMVQDPCGYQLRFTTSGEKVIKVAETSGVTELSESGSTTGGMTGASKTISYSSATRRTIVKTNKNVRVEYLFKSDGSLIAELEKNNDSLTDTYYPTVGKAMGFYRNEQIESSQSHAVPMYCTTELDLSSATKVGDVFTTQTLVNNSATSGIVKGNPIVNVGGIYVFICWAKATSKTGTGQYYSDAEMAKPLFGIQVHTTNANDQNIKTLSYTPFQEDVTGWQMIAIPIDLSGESCVGLRFEFLYTNQEASSDAYVVNGRLYKTSGAVNYVYDGDYSITETNKYSNVTLYDQCGNAVKNILRKKGTNGYTTIGTSTTTYNSVDDEYVTSQTDISGIQTSYSYNAYLQPTQIIKTGGGLKLLEKKTYTNQILTTETDSNNKTVSYTKSNGLLTKAVDGTITTNYTYLTSGLLSSIYGASTMYGANGFTYKNGIPVKYTSGSTYYNFTYDGFGRVTEVTENGEVLKTIEYKDNESNIDGVSGATDKVAITFANKFKTESYSDKYGNVIQVREDESASTVINYNSEDHSVESVLDNIGGIRYNYKYSSGKLFFMEKSVSAVSALDYTKTPSYDVYGEESGVTYFYNSTNHVYTSTKDEKTQAVTKYSTPIETVNYSYDGLGRIMVKTRAQGSFSKSIAYTYASNSSSSAYTTPRVSRMSYAGNKVWNYTYDTNGNITRITDGNGAVVASYEYDVLGRLTRENVNGYGTYVYAYDTRGNRTSKTTYAYTTGTVGTATSTVSATYDARNRMTMHDGRPISYDANGNPTAYKIVSLTWTRGRLLSSYYGIYNYTYDANGIRIKKVAGSTTTHYILDGETILAEYNGTAYKKFFYDESGIAGMIYNGATYYFMKNLQGDIVGVYDSAGTLLGEYVYDAWGNLLNSVTNDVLKANPFRYRGYYYDTETKLYYLNSRYYDPATGRFLNMDNISYLDPKSLGGLNLYAYCLNNPVMYTDRKGTNWWSDFWDSSAGSITKVIIGASIIVGLGIATVLTGGVVGAVVTGAFVGAITAGISSTIIACVTGQSFAEFSNSFLSGVLVGGITGAISGIGAPTGFAATSLGAKSLLLASSKSIFQYATVQVGLNAIIGGASYLIGVAQSKEEARLSAFSLYTTTGGIGGLLPSGLQGILMSTALDYISNQLENLFNKFNIV